MTELVWWALGLGAIVLIVGAVIVIGRKPNDEPPLDGGIWSDMPPAHPDLETLIRRRQDELREANESKYEQPRASRGPLPL